MGVVYSQAEFAGNLLPREGDHLRAANNVLDRVNELGSVAMVLVHGSVPEGRSNPRSDLDVLVNYVSPQETRTVSVRAIRELLEEISDFTKVKIEANIWSATDPMAAIENRMFDVLFSWHLARAMNNPRWIRGEIDQRIVEIANRHVDLATVRAVAMNYMVHKVSGFTHAPLEFNDSDPRCFAVMQRGLEFPSSAGRKASQLVLTACGEEMKDNLDPGVFLAMLGDTKVSDSLRELAEINKKYSEIIYAKIKGEGCDDTEYAVWLEQNYRPICDLGLQAASGLILFVNDFNPE